MKKTISTLASVLFLSAMLLAIGCAYKAVTLSTVNYDSVGNKVNEHEESIKARGFLTTSKTMGLSGTLTYTNRSPTNLTTTLFKLGFDESGSDVSTNAAELAKTPAGFVKEIGNLKK